MKAEDLTSGVPSLKPGDRVWHRIDWLGAGVVLANDPETNEHPIVRRPRESDTGRHVPAALLTKRHPLQPWRWCHQDEGGIQIQSSALIFGSAFVVAALIVSWVVAVDQLSRWLAP